MEKYVRITKITCIFNLFRRQRTGPKTLSTIHIYPFFSLTLLPQTPLRGINIKWSEIFGIYQRLAAESNGVWNFQLGFYIFIFLRFKSFDKRNFFVFCICFIRDVKGSEGLGYLNAEFGFRERLIAFCVNEIWSPKKYSLRYFDSSRIPALRVIMLSVDGQFFESEWLLIIIMFFVF